ncbi:ABC transporter permease [Rummeliibacillus sp. TYF005]|uniref:ABC transporter permease n=1 Tax=Rummeliibacillus sp. TYF005 TaxID=2058214 RepID=UPI000F534B26|nr:ABC transporter permease [Rummeliibacillus sp. TYF005]RPJ94395.1 ABC transporter permease [Rummeliibacillus sp. TYF005]
MKLSTLVLRRMRKNIKHYYLYFFALIFSAALYFSFVTLQHNAAVVKLSYSSLKAEMGFKVGSVLLLVIVFFFVFYANQLFLKRRSKEIGLYQMIGIPKPTISYMLTIENLILWVGASAIGMLIGFFFSRFFALLFLKAINTKREIELEFSTEALFQTMLVFGLLFIVVLLQMMWMVHRTTLLDLFKATSKADQKMKKMNFFQIILGIIGIGLISYGYYLSTVLFAIDKTISANDLYRKMGLILGSVIIGTFLVFRYSIAFIMNMIRMSKRGHLSLNDVLAITPIMHRMKSNTLSLSIITLMTAMALTILSLSYITYYSTDSQTEQNMPYDLAILNHNGEKTFEESLKSNNIHFQKYQFELLNVQIDTNTLLEKPLSKEAQINITLDNIVMKESDAKKVFPKLHLGQDEAVLTGYSDVLKNLMPLKIGKSMTLYHDKAKQKLKLIDIEKKASISAEISYGSPAIIIQDELFNQLKKDPSIQKSTLWKTYTGYNIPKENQLKEAITLYKKATNDGTFKIGKKDGVTSLLQVSPKKEMYQQSLENMGLLIFITGFLGSAFLLATGSILYFKQMTEAEEEIESYRTLRKIGFSPDEMMRGIYRKQLFSFGLPLLLGLCHSYFAVKSGWNFFGTELVVPLLTTMGIYILLYSIFAILTSSYYRKIIKGIL